MERINSWLVFVTVPSTELSNPINARQFKERRDDINSAFCDMFGGATDIGANGLWEDDNGKTVSEAVRFLFSVSFNGHLATDNLEVIAASLRDKWQQDCVLIGAIPAWAKLV